MTRRSANGERRIGLVANVLVAAVSVLSLVGFGGSMLWTLSQFKEQQAVFKATTTMQVDAITRSVGELKTGMDERAKKIEEHITKQDDRVERLLLDQARDQGRVGTAKR